MQTLSEMFERNVKLGQEVFEFQKSALDAGWTIVQNAVAANTELAMQYLRELQDAKSPAGAIETTVAAGTRATRRAAEQAGEAISQAQKITKDMQDLAKRAASA